MWIPRLDGGEGPLFRQIVQSLADDVGAGRLQPGAILPPHRDLADVLGVARGTVARAYREAEELGLVDGRVGSGTRVLAPDGGDRPYASLLEAPTVLGDLSTNLPLQGIDPDPADALRRLAVRPDRWSLLRYHPPTGTQRHRLAGARWLSLLGVPAHADEVALCAGAQHALYVVLSLVAARGTALYVESLTYPGMHGIAEALRLELIPIAMDEEGMVPADLARAARRHGRGAVYCMPTLHNPTCAVMSDERRAALASVARSRDLFLVEDAANRMLARQRPPTLSSYAPERSFLVASVSKVLSPGLRVAFVLAPPSERSAFARRVWATQWMVGALGAEIVAMWLEQGVVEQTLRNKRKEATRRQAIVREVLSKARVTGHPDALHAWVQLGRPWRPSVAPEIVVTPASAFWAGPGPAPNAIRIALGGIRDPRALRRALQRLAASLELDPQLPPSTTSQTAPRTHRRSIRSQVTQSAEYGGADG